MDGFRTVDAARFLLDAEDDLLGRVFLERYRLDEEIGSGGMGTVYRALQLAVNRPVAVKVLRQDASTDLKDVARFQQEARAIASLRHPNTVSLIDYGETHDGLFFLVMELVEGRSLKELIREEAPLDRIRAIHILAQIAESLTEAHELGIVHRDLKPANVLLTDMVGRRDFVQVVDFGIAKVTGPAAADTRLTGTGLTMGSPRYMSPEQASSMPITSQSDVYSIGTIFYELLTGRPVFDHGQVTEVLIAHLKEAPRPPSVQGSLLRGPEIDLCMACLAKLPSQRPSGAREVLEALQELSAAEVVALMARGERGGPTEEPTLVTQAADNVETTTLAQAASGMAETTTTQLVQDTRSPAPTRPDTEIPVVEATTAPVGAAGGTTTGPTLPGQHRSVTHSRTLVDQAPARVSSLPPSEAPTLFESLEPPGPREHLQTGHPGLTGASPFQEGTRDKPAGKGGSPRSWMLLVAASMAIFLGIFWWPDNVGSQSASDPPASPAHPAGQVATEALPSTDDAAPVVRTETGVSPSESFVLDSEPSGAEVILDGKVVGVTPRTLVWSSDGGSIEVRHTGYAPTVLPLAEVRPGDRVVLRLRARH